MRDATSLVGTRELGACHGAWRARLSSFHVRNNYRPHRSMMGRITDYLGKRLSACAIGGSPMACDTKASMFLPYSSFGRNLVASRTMIIAPAASEKTKMMEGVRIVETGRVQDARTPVLRLLHVW
eukprot:SAG11_NODE_443_length_9422_cov_4.441382_8_plen_125_part_00